ncbi:MAG: hypothetical protein ACK4OI_13720, partial [Rhizobium oryzihabitans]
MPDCASSLAAPAAATPPGDAGEARAQRGPFRPEVWLNARRRSSVRLAAHWFRALDVTVAVGLAALVLWALESIDLRTLPVGAVLPLAVGVTTVLALLRGLDLYRFE